MLQARGWNALFHAISAGHLHIVRRLLEDDKCEAMLVIKDTVSYVTKCPVHASSLRQVYIICQLDANLGLTLSMELIDDFN